MIQNIQNTGNRYYRILEVSRSLNNFSPHAKMSFTKFVTGELDDRGIAQDNRCGGLVSMSCI